MQHIKLNIIKIIITVFLNFFEPDLTSTFTFVLFSWVFVFWFWFWFWLLLLLSFSFSSFLSLSLSFFLSSSSSFSSSSSSLSLGIIDYSSFSSFGFISSAFVVSNMFSPYNPNIIFSQLNTSFFPFNKSIPNTLFFSPS